MSGLRPLWRARGTAAWVAAGGPAFVGALSATSTAVVLQSAASLFAVPNSAYLPGWDYLVIKQAWDLSLALSLAPLTDPRKAVSQSGARTS